MFEYAYSIAGPAGLVLAIGAVALATFFVARRILGAATAAARRSGARPILLTLGIGLASLLSLLFGGLLLLMGVGVVPPELDGEAVPLSSFLGAMWPLFLPILWSGVVAVGIWRRAMWSRWAGVATWLLLVPGLIATEGMTRTEVLVALAEVAALTLLAAWYFFGKSSVLAYYKAESRAA